MFVVLVWLPILSDPVTIPDQPEIIIQYISRGGGNQSNSQSFIVPIQPAGGRKNSGQGSNGSRNPKYTPKVAPNMNGSGGGDNGGDNDSDCTINQNTVLPTNEWKPDPDYWRKSTKKKKKNSLDEKIYEDNSVRKITITALNNQMVKKEYNRYKIDKIAARY